LQSPLSLFYSTQKGFCPAESTQKYRLSVRSLVRGERRFGRYFGIPKLMMILCIGMGVTYVADYLLAAYNISLSYYLKGFCPAESTQKYRLSVRSLVWD